MKILYFTATGNSLYIAKSFGGELYSIPQMIKNNKYNFSDDKIGIIFPIYALSVPPIIIDFLKKAQFECNYLFAIITYGMYEGASTNHLLTIGRETGLYFSYINRIKMVDNWLPRFDMNAQIKTESKKKIGEYLQRIQYDIESSNHFYVKDTLIDKFITNQFIKSAGKKTKKEKMSSHNIGEGINRFVTVEDTCNQCSVCIKVCPVDNIRFSTNNLKISFDDNCISCLACTHNCPQNSIHLKGEVSRTRFRNSNITLNEIIKANT